MWVTECSNAHSRGKMVMLEGMFAIGGVALAVWLDFGFFFLKNNSANWRFPIAFQAVFALGVASLIFMLPGGYSRSRVRSNLCTDHEQNRLVGTSRTRTTKPRSNHCPASMDCPKTRRYSNKKWKLSEIPSPRNMSELLAILSLEHQIDT